MRIEGSPDSITLDLFFDAQTSGGLLISVAPDRVEELIERTRSAGGQAVCEVGTVTENQGVPLVACE